MCIIIERQAGVETDKESFFTAIENNPDGYGLVVPNGDGSCTVIKRLDYDREDLWNLYNHEFADDKVMLHLRYTTAGETIYRNLHPFPILEMEADGVDLWMAHNGTLSSWKHTYTDPNNWESDTRHFVRRFVRPLFKRLSRAMTSEQILKDQFINELLDGQLSSASVLSFMDGYGNTMQVNPLGNGGKYEEGLWYSNEYSFDSFHRKPAGFQTKRKGGSLLDDQGYLNYGGYDSGWYNDPTMDAPSSTQSTTTDRQVGYHAEDTMQKTFSERRGMDPDDVYGISDEVLAELASDAPEALLELTKEMIFRAYQSEKELALLVDKKKSGEKFIGFLKNKLTEMMGESEAKELFKNAA